MPRITPITKDKAPQASQPMLEGIEKKLGRVPNLLGTLAVAPAGLAMSSRNGSQPVAARNRHPAALAVQQQTTTSVRTVLGAQLAGAYLRAHGIECDVIYKVNEGRPSLADEIFNRRIAMVINTPLGRESFFDDKAVRRAASCKRAAGSVG